MSLNESKPQNSLLQNNPEIKRKNISEDLGPDYDHKRQFKEEVETKPRLLAPSKLSYNKCNENPNLSLVLSTPKRLSDEREHPFDGQNKELSPLFKRIRKENNNCLLFDSKQFIKQELDTELDFNSRQPMANLFSKLSIDQTGIPGPESSHSYHQNSSLGHMAANDLSEVLKQLNICHKSNQNCDQNTSSSKAKKKKNKKSKKTREKKMKVVKNVFKTVYNTKTKVKSQSSFCHKKESKERYLFKTQSKVIKELKVSASGGLTADEVQTLMALRNEGIVRKNRRTLLMKCLLCTQRFSELMAVEDHIKGDCHIRNKSEQRYSPLDSQLALNLGQSSDIEIILCRKRVLSQMSNKTKELLHSSGVRLKDGFGSNAFICVDCRNEPFESLEAVFEHIKTKSRLIEGLNHISLNAEPTICDNTETNPNLKKMFEELTPEQIKELFDSEGITRRVHKNSAKKKLKYWCGLCHKYRMTKQQMYAHLNDSEHSKARTRYLEWNRCRDQSIPSKAN